ncbi:MAG: PD40 domain-containing protein [Sedimentisphaerales bacterium]|nr:PD40 domain-containing protein [Sedimentisphaerales bacterium]
MPRKAVAVALAAASLITAAILSRALEPDTRRIETILASYQEQGTYAQITMEYPLDGTLFPQRLPPPAFRWQDDQVASGKWLVRVAFADGSASLHFLVRRPRWTPRPQDWQSVERHGLEQDARVTVLGVGRGWPGRVLSRAQVSLRVSKDPVEAPLFYREVVLPFVEADEHPSRIRWRFGPVESPGPPPVVLQNLPVCANCHSFSRDGTIVGMDADYAYNKGAYIITQVQKQMTLTPGDIISWNDYERIGHAFGLLSQVSPDGRYVISTVKDFAVFITRPPLAFSQLFFPVKGILCVYDRQSHRFRALSGADDPNLVQSNPVWSPDGKYIVFARAQAADLSLTHGRGLRPLTRNDCEMLVADGKPFQFDLYRIPFNDGRGGTPEPLDGASRNGMSNYFARYSPDGRWIVFCQAKTYMLLQPDSELYIIPAEGGEARRLRCNTRRMNSWHSWSPNGKWLVFASKGYSEYTQLCLTHIDDKGDSTPAVLLSHLTAPDRAANIPEFVNAAPNAIVQIHERFVGPR